MTWCFSTRASVVAVLTMHPCISRCLRVKTCLMIAWQVGYRLPVMISSIIQSMCEGNIILGECLEVSIIACTLCQGSSWSVHLMGRFSPIFSCDQAALWMVQSVRLSVRPSVCLSVRPSVTPFWLCSHHPIIMKFSGVITSDKSDVHAKGQGQRSKVKVTEVTTQIFVSGL